MVKKTPWSKYVIAYLAWIIAFLLFLWFFIISRETVSNLLHMSLGQTLQQVKMQEFLNRMYTFLAGLAWLIFMIVTESYFRHGAEKGDLARRVTRFIGVELALTFIADFILALMIGLDILSPSRWILLIVEMVGGVGLIWLGFFKLKKVTRRSSQIG